MSEHRLQGWFATSVPVGSAAVATAAFVPCPCSITAFYTQAQYTFLAEVYRMARELTDAQLREPFWLKAMPFSVN